MLATLTRPALGFLVVGLLAACSTKRVLTIYSNPPGATAWVNGEQKGPTPVSVDFVHYGTFDVRLEKKGYQSLFREVLVPSQIDGYPIIDLPFELAVRERHFQWVAHLDMISAQPGEDELLALLETARAFREETHAKTQPDALPTFRLPFSPTSPGAPPPATPPPRTRPRPCRPPCGPPCPPPPPPPPVLRLTSSE